jgi:Uma2 family endonuclease
MEDIDMSEHSHFRMMACLYSSLCALFGQERAPYVAVQTPLYYDEHHPMLTKQPDLMVIKGVKQQERARYALWEEGQVPAVVFEITSGETWMEDLVNKSALYMQLGVKEYFIFDPYGEFLRNYVQGLRLVEKDGRREYVPIVPNKGGLLTSHELGTQLLVKNHLLRLVPHEQADDAQLPIPWAEELHGLAGAVIVESSGTTAGDQEALQAVEAQLRAAEARIRQAEERTRQVEELAKRNGQEPQRLKSLEAENAHLRVLLGQMQGNKVVRQG